MSATIEEKRAGMRKPIVICFTRHSINAEQHKALHELAVNEQASAVVFQNTEAEQILKSNADANAVIDRWLEIASCSDAVEINICGTVPLILRAALFHRSREACDGGRFLIWVYETHNLNRPEEGHKTANLEFGGWYLTGRYEIDADWEFYQRRRVEKEVYNAN